MRFLLYIIVVVPFLVSGKTLYVDASKGADANSGLTQAAAKRSIQAAVNAACEADTILVKSGTYAPFATSNKLVRIESISGPNVTVIDGGGDYSHDAGGWLNLTDLINRNPDNGWSNTNTIFVGFTVQRLGNTDGGTLPSHRT